MDDRRSTVEGDDECGIEIEGGAVAKHQSSIENRQSALVVVVGPTAAGKTDLAIELAETLGGEIISADSRQIYRGMDIGTAKATPEQRARVPHYLLDVVDPDQVLTLAEYQSLAFETIAGVQDRGSLPLLVGGSGQYVRAVVEGWQIPRVAPDLVLRSALEAEAREVGVEALHTRLARLDPHAAARIDYRNVRRVIRALEVCLLTGQPITELQSRRPSPWRVLWLGVTRSRAELFARIDDRVDRMVNAGLVDEVRKLADEGCGWELPAMTGLGYRQIGAYLRGDMDLPAAIALIKKGTRRFVRQQRNWFPPDDPAIRWFDPGAVPLSDVLALLVDFRGAESQEMGPLSQARPTNL
jgi:tRNA dimethylallyltransferase